MFLLIFLNSASGVRTVVHLPMAGIWRCLQGITLFFFMYVFQHSVICRPSDSGMSEDAGIDPRTAATLALTIRCSNHSARSHQKRSYNPTRLDLIHKEALTTRLDLIHNPARSHPPLGQISSTTRQDSSTTWLDLFHILGQILSTTRLYLIHNSARSHLPLGQISSTARLDSSTTRLDIILNSARSHSHTRLDLIQHTARSHLQRRDNHSDRSHPPLSQISSTTRLDLIHKLGQISSTYLARSYPPLGCTSSTTRLDLIHKLVQISSTMTDCDRLDEFE